MELSNKLFEVGTVSIADLEGYMNELSEEGRTLHSVHQTGGSSSVANFTVITYVFHDWALAEIQDKKKSEGELQSEKEAEKYWAAKMAENNGGHANE
jgi:hypothetical protein